MRKALIIITPIVTIATVVLHTLQILFGTDDKGFQIKGFYATLPLILIIIVSVIFSFVVMFATKNKNQSEKLTPRFSGIIFFISSVLFGIDAFKTSFENITSGNPIDVFPLILSVLEFLAAIILVVFACRMIMSFDFKFEKSLLLAIVPLVWLLVKLAYEFLSYTTVANISSYYYHVLMTASVLMFLLYYFKSTASNFYLSEASVIGFTLPVMMFSFTAIIPTAIDTFTNGKNIFETVTFFDLSCLFIAVFAYCVSIKLTFSTKDDII